MKIEFKKKEKLGPRERLNFFRGVRTYVKSGMNVVDSIEAYSKKLPTDSSFRKMCRNIVRQVRNGADISEAFKNYPKFFPSFLIGLLEIAQKTGQIPAVLDEICYYLKQDIDINKKIADATFMPKIAFIGTMVIFFGTTTFVVPKLGEFLTDANASMPLISSLVMGLGNVMLNLWFVWVLLAIGLVVGYQYFRKNYPEKYELLLLKIPFYRPIAYNRIQYTFTRVLGLCITAGIQPTQALSYTGVAVGNIYVKNVLTRAIHRINNGMDMDVALQKEDKLKLINEDIYVMIRTGSESGSLGSVMTSVSEDYQEYMEDAAGKIGDKLGTTVIVPTLAVTFLLLIAIEAPMVSMMQSMENVKF